MLLLQLIKRCYLSVATFKKKRGGLTNYNNDDNNDNDDDNDHSDDGGGAVESCLFFGQKQEIKKISPWVRNSNLNLGLKFGETQ